MKIDELTDLILSEIQIEDRFDWKDDGTDLVCWCRRLANQILLRGTDLNLDDRRDIPPNIVLGEG